MSEKNQLVAGVAATSQSLPNDGCEYDQRSWRMVLFTDCLSMLLYLFAHQPLAKILEIPSDHQSR